MALHPAGCGGRHPAHDRHFNVYYRHLGEHKDINFSGQIATGYVGGVAKIKGAVKTLLDSDSSGAFINDNPNQIKNLT